MLSLLKINYIKNRTVSIQETSNPKIIKFETDSFLTKYESFEFSSVDDAKNSPLAQQLFYLPFVKKVYISGNFVANKNLVTQPFEFTSIEEAKLSPFATALFQFPFVKAVFIDKNYVSITKFDIVE